MKTFKLDVAVEPLDDGRFLARSSNLQGCLAEGDTLPDALENLEDVARIIIELCLEKGLPLPPEMIDRESQPLLEGQLVVQVGH